MRFSSIINNNALATNLFFFNFSVAKRKEDGTTETTTYTIDIPDDFADMYCGERKTNKKIKNIFKDSTISDAQKYGRLANLRNYVRDTYSYKWAALMDSMELYYNPLYNVDGTEETTNVIAQRQTTDAMGAREDTFTLAQAVTRNAHGAQNDSMQYGATSESMTHGAQSTTTNFGATNESMQYGATSQGTQYGQDTTTQTNAPTETTEADKVNPFNDSDVDYDTNKKITSTIQTVDQTQRAQHTDTTTTQAHSDSISANAHSDSTSSQAFTDGHTTTTHTDTRESQAYTDTITQDGRTDKQNTGAQTNTRTEQAHTDQTTIRRFGNIGVTKSTELLRDYVNLQKSIYEVVLNDVMSILSVGY